MGFAKLLRPIPALAACFLLAADDTSLAQTGAFNVRAFGARGDNIADDTGAIQACIDAAIGDAAPRTSVREPKGPIYLPAGKYRITRPLRIVSAMYVKFHGDGASTQLIPVGALAAVLDLNGVAYSSFSDFMIRGLNEFHGVENAIYYYWDPRTAYRSSMRNVFERIIVQNVRCVTGMRVGMPGSGVQCDQTSYRDLSLEGNWWDVPKDPNWWRTGLLVGDGVFGNNLVHSAYNLEVGGWHNGIVVDASNFGLWGGSLGQNGVDILGNTHTYFVVEGVRSESSQRFFLSIPPSSNVSLYHFSDIIWVGDQIAPDGEFMRFTTNGNATITNLTVGSVARGVIAKIAVGPPISSTLRLSGIACPSGLDQFLAISPKVTTVVEGFYTYSNSSGQIGASEGLVTSGPVKATSLDLGGGSRWSPDGLYPGPNSAVKWEGAGGLLGYPDGSLRWVDWKTRRAGVVVKPNR